MCVAARLLMAFVLGVLGTVGYFVAPVAFSLFDKVAAGALMGVLLMWAELFAVVCILGVVFFCKGAFRKWLIAAAVLLGVQLVWLNPHMAALKAAGLRGEQAQLFAQLHGLSQVLYLFSCVLLFLWLIWQVKAHKQVL